MKEEDYNQIQIKSKGGEREIWFATRKMSTVE